MQRQCLQFRRFLSRRPLEEWRVFWEVQTNVCSIFVLLPEHLLALVQGKTPGQVHYGADPLQSSLCPTFHTRPRLPLRQSSLNVACITEVELEHTFSFSSQSKSQLSPVASEHRPLLVGCPYRGRQSHGLCGCWWEP